MIDNSASTQPTQTIDAIENTDNNGNDTDKTVGDIDNHVGDIDKTVNDISNNVNDMKLQSWNSLPLLPITYNNGQRTHIPVAAMCLIMHYLPNHCDRLAVLSINRCWSAAAAAAIYTSPHLTTSMSFERLLQLVTSDHPFHPYASLITTLNLCSPSAADNIFMGDLDLMLSHCSMLQVFRLEHCFHISNILVRSLSVNCQNLRQMDLPGCPGITDTFIPTLTKSCHNLEVLDLAFTGISLASLPDIIANCANIIELNLCECKDPLTPITLEQVQADFKRPLSYLNMRNTPMTDALLRFVAIHCPFLNVLIVESCNNVSDNGVMKIVNTCVKLEVLDCSFCDKVTDISLQVISIRAAAQNGGALQELHLAGCDGISPASVLQLVQKCSKLELLVLDGCDALCMSYIQGFATYKEGDVECTFERDDLAQLVKYALGSTATGGRDGTPSVSNSVHASRDFPTSRLYTDHAMYTPPLTPPRHGKQRPLDLTYLGEALPPVTSTDASFELDKGDNDDTSTTTTVALAAQRDVCEVSPTSVTSSLNISVSYATRRSTASLHCDTKNKGESNSVVTGSGMPPPLLLPRRASRALRPRRSSMGVTSLGGSIGGNYSGDNNSDGFDEVEAALHERVERIREKRRQSRGYDSGMGSAESPCGTTNGNDAGNVVIADSSLHSSPMHVRSQSFSSSGWGSSPSAVQESRGDSPSRSGHGLSTGTAGSTPASSTLLVSGRRPRPLHESITPSTVIAAASVYAAPFVPGTSLTTEADSTSPPSGEFLDQPTPGALSGQRLLLASGRRHRDSTLHLGERESASTDRGYTHRHSMSSGHCSSPSWGSDPSAWTNPTLHTSSSSTWRTAAAASANSPSSTLLSRSTSLRNSSSDGSGAPGLSSPLARRSASPSMFVDPWASPVSTSPASVCGSPGVSGPPELFYAAVPSVASHRMSLPAAPRTTWDTPVRSNQTPSRQAESPPGWSRSGTNGGHLRTHSSSSSSSSSTYSSPPRRTTTGSGGDDRFSHNTSRSRSASTYLGAAGPNSNWRDQNDQKHNNSHSHNQQQQQRHDQQQLYRHSGEDALDMAYHHDLHSRSQRRSRNYPTQRYSMPHTTLATEIVNVQPITPAMACATHGRLGKVFQYYPPTPRGPLLLNLQIETPGGGLQTLNVHALDDPLALSSEFCVFWGMSGFTDALRRVIIVRKRNVERGASDRGGSDGYVRDRGGRIHTRGGR
ncbi:hypothetical protein BSLG_003979 [Batrachochytrium salamandrivorans]|nr:hypothetical protein BSLG_003979 [Batrachochytrium salamandrivorans]